MIGHRHVLTGLGGVVKYFGTHEEGAYGCAYDPVNHRLFPSAFRQDTKGTRIDLINKSTDQYLITGLGGTVPRTYGAVYYNNRIFQPRFFGSSSIIVSINSLSTSFLATDPQRIGAILAYDGVKLFAYTIPFLETGGYINKIDLDIDSKTDVGLPFPANGNEKYKGPVLGIDGKIYAPSSSATGNILEFDPTTDIYTTHGSGLGNYQGGCNSLSGDIYFMPLSSGLQVLKFNITTKVITHIGSSLADIYGAARLLKDGTIMAFGISFGKKLEIDPSSDTVTESDFSSNDGFRGIGVDKDGNVLLNSSNFNKAAYLPNYAPPYDAADYAFPTPTNFAASNYNKFFNVL